MCLNGGYSFYSISGKIEFDLTQILRYIIVVNSFRF